MSALFGDAERVVTPADIATLLAVSRRTVLRWIERRDLAAYRIGGVTRIRHADLEAFLRQHFWSTSEEDRVTTDRTEAEASHMLPSS